MTPRCPPDTAQSVGGITDCGREPLLCSFLGILGLNPVGGRGSRSSAWRLHTEGVGTEHRPLDSIYGAGSCPASQGSTYSWKLSPSHDLC